jgi:HPr kinase/phosphorylase
MAGITVFEFMEKARGLIPLECLTGDLPGRRPITTSDVHRPGLALVGYLENFLADRILVFGQTEIAYLKRLAPEQVRDALAPILAFDLPCVLLSKQLEPPPQILAMARERGIPVLRTSLQTTDMIHRLRELLEDFFAPTTSVHGSLVDVYGVGLLFTGRSGIGKSECALDLVERGHRLVADDVVTIRRKAANVLIGSGNELLRHCMEIRGIGIIDVQAIFGIRAIRAQKRVEVEVNLREWDAKEDYERLGVQEQLSTMLDVPIALVVVPIFPGKNITVISETIALNYLVKAYGYNPAEHFSDNLAQLLRRKANLETLAKDDLE